MAQNKFIIDGGFSTNADSEITGTLAATVALTANGVDVITNASTVSEAKDVVRATAAASDATTKADAAQAAAEATASADATSKANAAQAAAEATATAADTAQTTSINTAWAAADTAQTTSINTAWAAGDAAVTTAMQTYADTAETDAIASAEAKDVVRATAAASDATSKANAAQAAAEATASADATTKVNALETSLIDGAPGTMNTLNELAAAMADDANMSTTITNLISAEATTARAAEAANAAAITAGDAAVTTAMQTYADQAEADAESAAATDATTKADAAQAAAIASAEAKDVTRAATAAADATTKADAALASALAADSDTTYTASNGVQLAGTVFSMSGSYTGSFTATGDITAYSDDSLKTNVQVIDGALGRVEAIRGVTFDRIEDGSTSTGVIAQELKEVLPQAVHTDAEGVHSVAYGNITGLLIEAIKELSAQVEVLKSK